MLEESIRGKPLCQALFQHAHTHTRQDTAHTRRSNTLRSGAIRSGYCTYHCGPLRPLTCFRAGRPGRKPWRGSCSSPPAQEERGDRDREVKLWEQESHSLVQRRLSAAFPRVLLQLALKLIKAPADCTVPRSILWLFVNSSFYPFLLLAKMSFL